MTARSRVNEILAGKYKLTRCLGSGGMGEVYEARHLELGRRVAIKMLRDEAARDAGLVARFRVEARAAGALSHENIAAVYDTGVHDGADFLVMDLLEGQDCASLLSSHGRLPPTRVLELALQVCRGLARAHASGIIHRDLKPANLFVCARPDGSDLIKILDFGVAKLRADLARSQSAVSGPAIGTPHYMSPEQARGDELIDGRADLYSLGVVLYELLSGRRPIEPGTPLQVLHHVLTQVPVSLSLRCPELPLELSGLVDRALAKRREDRFASADELAAAIAGLLSTQRLQLSRPAQYEASLETAASPPTNAGKLFASGSAPQLSAVAAPTQAGYRSVERTRRRRHLLAGAGGLALLGGALLIHSASAPTVALHAGARASASSPDASVSSPLAVAPPPAALEAAGDVEAPVGATLTGVRWPPDASATLGARAEEQHALTDGRVARPVLQSEAPMASRPRAARPFARRAQVLVAPASLEARASSLGSRASSVHEPAGEEPESRKQAAAQNSEAKEGAATLVEQAVVSQPKTENTPDRIVRSRRLSIDHQSPYQ